jgi:hypothetical protein
MNHKRIPVTWKSIHVLLITAMLLSACAGIRTGSHQDESVSLSAYQSFAWMTANPYVPGDNNPVQVSPLSQKMIAQAIESELKAKGFTMVDDPESADFVLSYTVGTRERIDVSSYPNPYRGDWGWHLYGRQYQLEEVTHRSYTEGTLGIDIFDGSSKQPVWHGWATKTVSTADRENPGPSISKAVAAVFERFPSAL